MFFDRGLKDNITLRREDGGRRSWLLILLALVIVVLAVGVGGYAWKRYQSVQGAKQVQVAEPAQLGPEQQALTQIRSLVAAKSLVRARELCYRSLDQCKDPGVVTDVERLLGQININLLLTPALMPEKVEYVVQGGDSLERIAKKFGTTVELIRTGNDLKGRMIHPGDRLTIFKAVLTLAVSKSRNDMLLKANDRFFKRYQVGTGQYGKTPAGTFVISEKIVEPPWWRPDGKMIPFGDKDNVLGTRWMSITPVKGTPSVSGYGIHGTWEPDTVGKQASAGCIRLVNSDVEELFMLIPLGARVVITE
ncbi:MAG: L,D-transpeptidase family protein [Verrucomicrobia bacterium]|nr:L,D-transpeptidase family protein [Verrucomicrobiota bacterium]MBU4291730.1 L,D-transpeptidase family protein [Verrucomicrobiota bacterium]MBU4427781.1 L,D-transpeptidase family protein [Verrucomicrobiota bacterium]MCG2681281.1 L,D-transpeptidase family protein [Kiritimatiellia bacterium]